MNHLSRTGPIGIFDSGYGGLTVFREILKKLPQYDYIYLGDNARAPYGPRSFDVIYQYTLECVRHLFEAGCPLVILACNTASAKALRTIQQRDLPRIDPARRVLGVIRPTAEMVGYLSQSGSVGILATSGTVLSESYILEIAKFFPDIRVFQQACPMWVPLVENNEHLGPGADYFIHKYVKALIEQAPEIDVVVLGCTHYPLLQSKIEACLPPEVKVISQGAIVADRLADYLERHPEMETRLHKGGKRQFYTTESPTDFDVKAAIFLGEGIRSKRMELAIGK